MQIVNNCKELFELISASIDNEISASEKQLVEAHLLSCPSCMRYIAMFRDVSSVLASPEIKAPAELSTSVMSSIRGLEENANMHPASFDKQAVTEENKKISKAHLWLRRYAVPIAACVALTLLALPIFLMQDNDISGDDFDRGDLMRMITEENELYHDDVNDIAALELMPGAIPPDSQVMYPAVGRADRAGDQVWLHNDGAEVDEGEDDETFFPGEAFYDFYDSGVYGLFGYDDLIEPRRQRLENYFANVLLNTSELPPVFTELEYEPVRFIDTVAYRISIEDYYILLEHEFELIAQIIFGNSHSNYIIIELARPD